MGIFNRKPQFTGAHVGQLITGSGSDRGKAGHVVDIVGSGDDTEFITDKGDSINIKNVNNVEG